MIASPENRLFSMNGSSALKPVARNFLNGFNSERETEALRRNINAASKNRLISVDALENALSENLANIASHRHEYTMSDPVVLNPVDLDEKGRLVNAESGYRILDMISPDERGGAVIDFVGGVEKILAAASLGDMVIGISPAGHTGRFEQGKEIIYEETQVYAFRKGRGKLLGGITFISDLTFEQCLNLYGEYGKIDEAFQGRQLSERQKIEEMTRRPILITGGNISFENILDSIEAKIGGAVMRQANGMNRTFEEARVLLKDPGQLKALPDDCFEVLAMYRCYLESNIGNINDEEVFKAVKQRMEIAMLEITRLSIKEKKETHEVEFIYEDAFSGNNIDLIDYNRIKSVYEEQIRFLMMRPGCLGKVDSKFSLTGQSLGDILSGTSNIKSLLSGSAGTSESCKICGINQSVGGGCGYCHGCADKAA